MKANLSRLLSRGLKPILSLPSGREKSHNYINDTEVEVQRRRTAGWEVFNHINILVKQYCQLL